MAFDPKAGFDPDAMKQNALAKLAKHAPTREERTARAKTEHDKVCKCDEKYLMSCPKMAQAILNTVPSTPVQRLARIAEAHHKHVDQHGGTYGECNECNQSWPCPTYDWATTERHHLATWDPRDDG